jgi:hypothetical protein
MMQRFYGQSSEALKTKNFGMKKRYIPPEFGFLPWFSSWQVLPDPLLELL